MHTFVGAVDRVECVAEIVGEWVGGEDGVLASLDLNGAVQARSSRISRLTSRSGVRSKDAQSRPTTRHQLPS